MKNKLKIKNLASFYIFGKPVATALRIESRKKVI
jgi:hypothetical protein